MTIMIRENGAPRAHIRRAKDCLVQLNAQQGELHRAAHSSIIDYKLQDITANSARAAGTTPGFCEDKAAASSPWHWHDCDMQIGVVLEGSVEMAFADGNRARICKGDIGLIPGHVPHDVRHTSGDFATTEFTFPGDFGTVECEMPAVGTPTEARRYSTKDALRVSEERGLLTYKYPLHAPYDQRYAIYREHRSRVADFVPGSMRHDDKLQLFYMLSGIRTIRLYDEETTLGPGDLLVLPGGIECDAISASDPCEALRFCLLKELAN